MPGPIGNGGFNGGIRDDGTIIQPLSIDYLADLFAEVTNAFGHFWQFLNMPTFDAFESIMEGDGEGVLSYLGAGIVKVISTTNLDNFLNNFTVVQLVLYGALVFTLIYGVMKFFVLTS